MRHVRDVIRMKSAGMPSREIARVIGFRPRRPRTTVAPIAKQHQAADGLALDGVPSRKWFSSIHSLVASGPGPPTEVALAYIFLWICALAARTTNSCLSFARKG
jgi:hypothetical protein